MDIIENAKAAMAANEFRKVEAQMAQIALPSLLSGDATWNAMKNAVEQLRRTAPKDHDIVMKVSDVTIIEAYFIEPHAFLFEGTNDVGESTWIGLHFTQLVFAVIHRPKRNPEPVCTLMVVHDLSHGEFESGNLAT